jgi:hypothetical protein
MGFPAAGPLIERLRGSYTDTERVRAARIIGELCRVARKEDGHGRDDIEEMLRQLQRASIGRFPDKGALFVAMAKLATSPLADREFVRIVERAVIERQNEEGVGLAKYEALGWLASAAHADQRRVRSIVAMFQDVLNTEPPEIEAKLTETEDGNLFDVGSQAEFYTEVIPEAIRGLTRIALGPGVSRGRREEITSYLMHKWLAMVAGQAVWGPGNAAEMVESLRVIGCDGKTPVSTRIKIIRALGRRIAQVPVQKALAAIFAADDDSTELAALASSAGLALLKRKEEFDELDEEDREHYYGVLSRIAGRTALDTTDEKTVGLRSRLADAILEGLRDRIPGCYDMLARLREKESLPEEFREKMREKLKSYEQMELYTEGR